MHILTGLILAGLAGKTGEKSSRATSPIQFFRTGPLRTLHYLPGRVRLLAPDLKDDRHRCELLQRALVDLQGIQECTVDFRTGSILVRHEEEEVSAELLFGTVARLLHVEKEIENAPEPLVVQELREFGGSINRVVHEKSHGMIDLWSGLMLTTILVGMGKFIAEGRSSLPSGFTLLWLATFGLFRTNGGKR